MEETTDALPDTPLRHEKHVRLTQHGKMKSWITMSLQFLSNPEEEEDKSLTLHTLPHLLNTRAEPPAHTADAPAPSITPHAALLVTSVVPRLISVVEILKREYMTLLERTKSSRVIGLHQYNELGTLEELGVIVDQTEGGIEVIEGKKIEDADKEKPKGFVLEERRSKEIIQALNGKNHPKQIQTPFMRVTLSTVERPDLLAKGASYQPPAVRKQSKAAKARAKKQRAKVKRVKDAAAGTDANAA